MAETAHRVLSVASECVPFIKTGGLADVVGALPVALKPLGWESRVLLPGYPGVLSSLGKTTTIWEEVDLFGGPASVGYVRHQGMEILVLEAAHLYDRAGGPYGVDGYDHHDNHVRFAALSWVGAQLSIHGGYDLWRPDIVHVHDWQSGLLPSYLKYAGSHVPSVMTVHNIAFQGLFGADQLDRLRLPTWDFHPDSLEYHGMVSTLKAGMVHASALTTVSPTYAMELTNPEFGFGLEGVVAARRDRGELFGIINGIDTTLWNPADDPAITPYSSQDPAGKAVNRRALLQEFELENPSGPLAVVVTRLTHQKGVDLLLETIPRFVEAGGAVVVLGSGEPEYEEGLRRLVLEYPQSVGLRLGYDEALSHRMYAGGDLVLMPSRFEPCGLTQLYGLRYGALPVVGSTGGLRDTVTDASVQNRAVGTANGFVCGEKGSRVDGEGLRLALDSATELYADEPSWAQVRKQAMMSPVDWGSSARQYAELFAALLS